MTARQRYCEAHRAWMGGKYPTVVNDGHYSQPVYPKVSTSNGLTKAIINFLTWRGHRATRINSTGRIIKTPQRQESGVSLMTAKYIPGTTRRGTADISSTIIGRSVMWEVKIGADRPSEYQLLEQQREQAAGGLYIFVKTFDQFLDEYDNIVLKHS